MGKVLVRIIVVMLILVSCEPRPSKPIPKFWTGDVVVIAQTDEKVTVLNVWYVRGEYMYECRVALPVTVRWDGLVSRDSEVSRYSTIWFREFELYKR